MNAWYGTFLVCGAVLTAPVFGGSEKQDKVFMKAKTFFQTDRSYVPRLGISTDGVVVHRHGVGFEDISAAIASWQARGGTVGRMFFVDSDGANAYWTGKWDGIDHSDDVERKSGGEKVMCAGVRPYMVPTEGWTKYLEGQAELALRAGATAILPEEPLAHAFSGYSKSFQELWKQHYGFAWQAQDSSAEARFLTGQLKSKLYLDLEEKLMETTHAYRGEDGIEASFIIPIHSIYGNMAAQLVAPLGDSTHLDGVDGYIGQIWTGPVNWALAQYDSTDKSFFGSAFALYDYFTQLTVGTDKKLWLLVDPVEDNLNHEWGEFAEWYHHCVAAMLLMSGIDSYEIMPWPDRVFLPGFDTGGGTPAPESFTIPLLAITQALQEMPLGGEWDLMDSAQPSAGISVAIADSAMWQPWEDGKLQGTYGMLMPLIQRGVPAGACVLERSSDKAYMDRHRVILLSYESFKPVAAGINEDLAEWVRRGGVLILLGEPGDELDRSKRFWWRRQGFASPTHHLISLLDKPVAAKTEWSCGEGYVIRKNISPKKFARPAAAEKVYLPLVDQALQHATEPGKLQTPGHFIMRRGPFVVAHAMDCPVELEGWFVDIFDPDLPVVDGIHLAPGGSGLYRDVVQTLESEEMPKVLHATHRLVSQQSQGNETRFTVKGPAETPAVARLFFGKREILDVSATTADGRKIEVDVKNEKPTARLKFANDPDGVDVVVTYKL